MFVDRVRILARAGKGGRGCVSFLRELHRPNGGPDGGDGGKGGNIVLEVDPHLNNLAHLSYKPHQFAPRGEHGASRQMAGKNAKDLVLKVPPGTIVSRLESPELGEEYDENGDPLPPPPEKLLPVPLPGADLEIVTDLLEPGSRYVLCQGGDGGRGNRHFKSSINQVPRRYEEGWPGESGQFLLELKSIADVGLVGYPNAGKSTLLSRLSKAQPKIGHYPFTTLEPMIGVVEYPDFSKVSVADIPGLIEGAHEGRGLGHEFLRHIERCAVLLFVIDLSGQEGREPAEDFALLRRELKLYRADLADRPFLVVANKIDLPGAAENLAAFKKKVRKKVHVISAQEREGIEELKKAIREAALD
ncbi:MAG: GTPase ObgE [Verrucomicrobium sp.]|nr:GTPase ObgE [Verrucomicrobium sp.]